MGRYDNRCFRWTRIALTGLILPLLATGANYFYDYGGRLVKIDYGTAGVVTYTYDAAGNLIGRQLLPPVSIGTNGPVITAVINAEGGAQTIAPNTWVEINGTNLSPAGDSRPWGASDFASGVLPSQLDNVSVTINGKSAFVYYISPTQINILTPPDPMPNSVSVQVTNGTATSAPFTAQTKTASPSFFVFAGGYVAAVHVNGTLIGPTTLYPGASTPAAPSETVVLFGNGFGATSTPVTSASLSQGGSLPTMPVIKIGGTQATVLFAGLISPGLYQFNVVVPSNLSNGDNSIAATYNGSSTQSGLLINLQH